MIEISNETIAVGLGSAVVMAVGYAIQVERRLANKVSDERLEKRLENYMPRTEIGRIEGKIDDHADQFLHHVRMSAARHEKLQAEMHEIHRKVDALTALISNGNFVKDS